MKLFATLFPNLAVNAKIHLMIGFKKKKRLKLGVWIVTQLQVLPKKTNSGLKTIR